MKRVVLGEEHDDSTCEDAIQEYGVLRQAEDGTWRQVESITVSWCGLDKLRYYIDYADAAGFDREATLDERVQAVAFRRPEQSLAPPEHRQSAGDRVSGSCRTTLR